MAKKVSVTSRANAVYARCVEPRGRCPLVNLFAPLPNIRICKDALPSGAFVFSIILRGTAKEKADALPQVKNLVKQICKNCQDTRIANKLKTR